MPPVINQKDPDSILVLTLDLLSLIFRPKSSLRTLERLLRMNSIVKQRTTPQRTIDNNSIIHNLGYTQSAPYP